MQQYEGFSLMELLVVIAIVGILASVALPSYNDSITKTRRSDASVALSKAAMEQERYYTLNNKFSASMADLGGATSEDGLYTLSVDVSACTDSCFKLNATPVVGKSQANDETCWTISIEHTGKKSSKTKGGVANPSKTCW